MNIIYWYNDVIPHTMNDMPLHFFATNYYVGSKGSRRNKICVQKNQNNIPVFYPNISGNPKSDLFCDYCKYYLIKYEPWMGNFHTIWIQYDMSTDDIICKWELFVDSQKTKKVDLPDYVRRQIDDYKM